MAFFADEVGCAEGGQHDDAAAFDAEDAEVAGAVDEGEAVVVNAAASGKHQAEAAGVVVDDKQFSKKNAK